MYKKWAAGLKPKELGVTTALTDTLLRRVNQEVYDTLVKQATSSMARAMIAKGLVPKQVEVSEGHDPSLRLTEAIMVLETAVQPTLIGYTGLLEDKLFVAKALLSLPWYKLAWRRLKGRLGFDFPWEQG